jgi:prepilin-type N-terminal cleavage/methylation domain-containing protein/prepilin-type processing-associated H-X9-DG protein
MFGNHTHAQGALRSAFTLIELLVVIAISGVLIGLLLVAVQKVRQTADRMRCQNNLKQLALAGHLHHDAKGKFPTGVHALLLHVRYPYGTAWEVELLPYFEQENVYQKWNYTDEHEKVAGGRAALTAQVIKLLLCPSDPLPDPVQPNEYDDFYGVGSYGGNAGRRSFSFSSKQDGIFFPDSKIRLADVTDGASNTFFFGERSHGDKEFDLNTWYSFPDYYPLRGWGKWAYLGCPPHHHLLSTAVPIDYQTPPWPSATSADIKDRVSAFGSGHPGGANFAFVDGSVRFLNDQTNLETLQALSTRAGGEAVDAP